MSAATKLIRRAAGAAYRQLFPTPELAAWRHADQLAGTIPRHTAGSIRMLDYELQYADLLSVCPQWHDIFVQGALEFRATSESPRILDCGANVGLASLFFKRRYPAARITAYEADPALCAIARANLASNGAADVEIVNAALWTSAGRGLFPAQGTHPGTTDRAPRAGRG